MLQTLIPLLLLATTAFAQPLFMLGAKTFTLDFKGYSGFMAELGGGTGIAINEEDIIFLGVNSGLGFAGDSKKTDMGKFEYSSLAIPIKVFGSYGMIGASIGTLLTFWNINSNISKNENGVNGAFDFGLMIFPLKRLSIGFDVILSDGATGFALGLAHYFGKKSYHDNYQNEEDRGCAVIADEYIENVYVEIENKNKFICIKLKNGAENCINLSDKFDFQHASMEDIRDFSLNYSYLKFENIPHDIEYKEFFPNGTCIFNSNQYNSDDNNDKKGKKRKKAEDKGCAVIADGDIANVYVEIENENKFICMKLKIGKESCLNLNDKLDFENARIEDIENYSLRYPYLKFENIPHNIKYKEFFPNGTCNL